MESLDAGGFILHAVMSERIGERHASACRYKKTIYRRAHATPLAGLISGRAEYMTPGDITRSLSIPRGLNPGASVAVGLIDSIRPPVSTGWPFIRLLNSLPELAS